MYINIFTCKDTYKCKPNKTQILLFLKQQCISTKLEELTLCDHSEVIMG